MFEEKTRTQQGQNIDWNGGEEVMQCLKNKQLPRSE